MGPGLKSKERLGAVPTALFEKSFARISICGGRLSCLPIQWGQAGKPAPTIQDEKETPMFLQSAAELH
jgi:hypothetical protein